MDKGSCHVKTKPTRRGRGYSKKSIKELSLYFININGFKSKALSLKNILNDLDKPEIVVLCEIKSVSEGFIKKFFKSEGYDTIINKSAGLLVAAKNNLDMVNVTSNDNNQSVTAASIKIGGSYITVLAVYGPQENKSEEVRSAFYDDIRIEIESSMKRGEENLALVGDFNAKINADNTINNYYCEERSKKNMCVWRVLHVL